MHKKLFNFSMFGALTLTSSLAMAHLNIAVEDAISVGDGARVYKEGSSAFIDVNISHDCSNAAGEHFPTTGVSLLLPNGAGIEGTYTGDGTYGANGVMGVKQKVSHTFKKNKVVRGAVDSYYSHGEQTEDARALKWWFGKVDNDHYDNLELKAGFPSIKPESCLKAIKLYFPSIQYCTEGYKMAWINTGESKFGMGDELTKVYDTYAAYITVQRTSDLPENCEGDGETVEVMPTVDEIDTYLDTQMTGRPRRHFGNRY